MPQPDQYDVIILGAGIGGGALSTVLARAGRRVLVLEKTAVHRDRVRGEWVAPWGVAETKRVGLYDTLVAAGAHHLTRHVGYTDAVEPAEAEAAELPLGILIPGIPGPLCLGHPKHCDTLNAAAVAAGATLLREANVTSVTLGDSPSVTFTHGGVTQTARARLDCMPLSKHLADATPAGPCHSYPNEDAWMEEPFAPGMVLIGDAAGWNDPILGQGMSVTYRDVRIVSELLLGSEDCSKLSFAPYAEERRERMRRLRTVATLQSIIENEFGPAAQERRRRVHERRMTDPAFMAPLLAGYAGPETVAGEALGVEACRRLLE